MRALKGLVIGMGILIVVGMFVLGYGIVRKASDPDFRFFKPAPDSADSAAPPAAGTAFGEVGLGLPEGCDIVDMRPEDGRLYLRIGPAGPCRRVVVVDPATGTVLGTISVKP